MRIYTYIGVCHRFSSQINPPTFRQGLKQKQIGHQNIGNDRRAPRCTAKVLLCHWSVSRARSVIGWRPVRQFIFQNALFCSTGWCQFLVGNSYTHMVFVISSYTHLCSDVTPLHTHGHEQNLGAVLFLASKTEQGASWQYSIIKVSTSFSPSLPRPTR